MLKKNPQLFAYNHIFKFKKPSIQINSRLMSENKENKTEANRRKKKSKRNRSLTFDLSRTSISSPLPKLNKKTTMPNTNANSDPSIRDLSGSITNANPSTSAEARLRQNNPQQVVQPNLPVHPVEVDNLVRSLVHDSLAQANNNLRSLVQESVSSEMKKIYGVINTLSDAVSKIFMAGQNTTQHPTASSHNDNPTHQSLHPENRRPTFEDNANQVPPLNRDHNPHFSRRNTVTPSFLSF